MNYTKSAVTMEKKYLILMGYLILSLINMILYEVSMLDCKTFNLF